MKTRTNNDTNIQTLPLMVQKLYITDVDFMKKLNKNDHTYTHIE